MLSLGIAVPTTHGMCQQSYAPIKTGRYEVFAKRSAALSAVVASQMRHEQQWCCAACCYISNASFLSEKGCLAYDVNSSSMLLKKHEVMLLPWQHRRVRPCCFAGFPMATAQPHPIKKPDVEPDVVGKAD
ncbi:hypothetical protein JOE11_002771 [Robbsia andropogonis]|uniref:hypothetical protein n=1 Tax=Robbsia andropogonis TaxID=28092 RepID=UPI0012F7CD93|nr:hypothetical protein [Robbsia andropogonis]MCP1118241.1 hypothetical protein [Robbsia andropogonis]MCP1127478.1 hypothetical protein [Robbsia andropogonis]